MLTFRASVVTMPPFPMFVAARLMDTMIQGLPHFCMAISRIEVDRFPYQPGNIIGVVSFCGHFVFRSHATSSVFCLNLSQFDVDDPQISPRSSAIWHTGFSSVGSGALGPGQIRFSRVRCSTPFPNAAVIVLLLCWVQVPNFSARATRAM